MKKIVTIIGVIFLYVIVAATVVGFDRYNGSEEAQAFLMEGEASFVLTREYLGEQQAFTVYRMLEKKGQESLCRLLLLPSFQVTDFRYEEETVIIIGKETSTGESVVYRYPVTESGGKLEKEVLREPVEVIGEEMTEVNTSPVERRWESFKLITLLKTLAVVTVAYAVLCIFLWLLLTKWCRGLKLFLSLAFPMLGISGAFVLLSFHGILYLCAKAMGGYEAVIWLPRPLLIGCLILWAVWNGLVLAILYGKLWPVSKIHRNLERMAANGGELPELSLPENELGGIWRSLNKLLKSYSVYQYTSKHVLRYYARFAPAGFERLLGKESIQEANVGDTTEIEGTIELISIPALRNREGVKQLNTLMQELEAEAGCGILLNGDRDFGKLRMVYEGADKSASRAFASGLRLMGSSILKKADIQPFVLLHTTSLICGLAGNRDNVYPFVDCQEMDILGRYSLKLRDMGVRMLLTEETKQRLMEKCEMRYIGYIRTTEEGRRFQLYEVLDACSAEDRYRKLQTVERFAEGLKLFYEDNFYLARMYFTEVLKECPRDGVARWYLFTCEKFFNMENCQDVAHNLSL